MAWIKVGVATPTHLGDQAMDGSIQLRSEERKSLLLQVRRGTDPQQRLHAHVLLLLADGWTWNVIIAVLFTSSSTINRWRRRFHQERLAALQPAEPKRGSDREGGGEGRRGGR